MAEDAAFVWDSAAARPARPAGPPAQPTEVAVDAPVAGGRWVTLRAAERAIGVPAATIRNWARKGRIPTRIDERAGQRRRLVDEVAARERARSLGRLGEDAPPEAPRRPPAAAAPVPDDHVLVPLDAWEKVLLQLGNLHAAGQELADARERAAKAETEAQFLRERLADMRAAREVAPEPEQPIVPPPADPRPVVGVASRYRALVDRLSRRRRR